jgi:hypothetical protein
MLQVTRMVELGLSCPDRIVLAPSSSVFYSSFTSNKTTPRIVAMCGVRQQGGGGRREAEEAGGGGGAGCGCTRSCDVIISIILLKRCRRVATHDERVDDVEKCYRTNQARAISMPTKSVTFRVLSDGPNCNALKL